MSSEPSAPMIGVTDLVKHFDSKSGVVKAVDGVSLSVGEGEVFGLLGPNGAGKTTLVKVIATLLKADSGTATVGGIDVANVMKVRPLIGLAGQFAAVDDVLTGRENLEIVGRLYQLGAAQAKKRAEEVLERLSLTEAADRLVRTYSGGMRRRLDLGASLVGQPTVLILDEPTTGLDPRTRLELWEFLRELVDGGTTVLLTTQYLEEADELANRIAVIDTGKIIAEGTSDELKGMLGGDVLMAAPTAMKDLAAVAAVIGALGQGEPWIDERKGEVSTTVANRIQALLSAGRSFEEQGIELRDLAIHRPSLDEVFLALTGEAAEARGESD